MRVLELFEEQSETQELVILPGGFHLFSPGHLYCWKYLLKKFPNADHYVASTNNTKERPFPFKAKQFLATQAGIPSDKFVEVKSPYRAIEITSNYESYNTILIFGVSEKDAERFGPSIKKDGSLSFLLPYPGSNSPVETMDKHAYYVIIPNVQKYKVLGQEVSSASQIRKMYVSADESEKYSIIKDLYPNSTKVNEIKRILDSVLVAPITEGLYDDIIWKPKKVYNIKTNEYPEYMNDGDVQRMIYDLHQQEEFDSDSDIWDRMDGDWYRLQNISIEKLDKINDLTVDDIYSDITTPFPPIVITKSGKILDGFHRTTSAKIRGDKTIRAYVPCKKPITEGIEPCYHCKGEGYIHSGNSGHFCKYCKGKGHIKVPFDTKKKSANDLNESIIKNYPIQRLKEIAEKFRSTKENEEDWEGPKNNCYSEAFDLAQEFKKYKIFPRLIRGWYILDDGDVEGHSWLQIGDKIVDTTADQFYPVGDKNIYRVVITSVNDLHYSRKRPSRWAIFPSKQDQISESPDFGYKHFNDRDEDISKLKWEIDKSKFNGWYGGEEQISIIIKAISSITNEVEGFINANEEHNKSLRISRSQITNGHNWESTGLGQLLYDKLIQFAKKNDFKYVNSDTKLSGFARKAWAKLSQRYPVEKFKSDGENYFSIDLSKVGK